MATLDDRLKDAEYTNWVKTSLCLGYAKDGLETFANQSSTRLHQHVTNKLGNNPSANALCNKARVIYNKSAKKWGMSCCNNCGQYVDELVNMKFAGFDPTQDNWNNASVQLWPHEPWEMAKIYMNAGQKGAHKTPKDTDLSGVLNFIDHCMMARGNIIDVQNIPKVRKARNDVMHSALMKITALEFQTHSGAIIDLLEDGLLLCTLQDAKDAVLTVKEVQRADFQITKETEFSVLSKQLAQILHENEAMRADFRILESKWRDLEDSVEDDIQNLRFQLETEIKERENDIKKLTAAFVGLQKLVHLDDNLRQKYDADLAQVETSVRETHKELEIVKDRVTRLEHELCRLEVRQLKLEAAQSKLPETVEDTFPQECEKLKQHLLEEYRRIHFKVSLSPIYEGLNDDVLQVPVEELYTDVTIVRPDKKKEIALTSYKEMIQTKGTRNKTIFMKGEAGVGKSTWCMQLVNAWCKAHCKNSNDPSKETREPIQSVHKEMEDVMSQFEYLIFVQLRYVEGHTSILDLIFSSTLERLTVHEATFRKIIEKCSEEVLIILDGLDEYAKILDYKGLNKCTVISTTRPWKYDIVCSKSPKLKVDLLLKLKGLNSDGVAELSKKVIKILTGAFGDDTQDEDGVNDFDEQASECVEHFKSVGLSESVKIPLILIFMVECWFENEKQLSPSLTCNLISLLIIILQRGKQKLSESDKTAYKTLKSTWYREDEIPACFSENTKISKHYGLLLQLSHLAYLGLSSKSKELSLVFKEKQLKQHFKPGETDVCYKFGLLSKSKMSTSLTGPINVSVSFYHKLVQEFFAALWIIEKTDAFETEKETLTSINKVLEMENVILFVCGLQPSLGTKLTEHFADMCNNDPAVVKHRSLGINYRPMDSFTKLIRKCKEEVNHGPDPEAELYIPDVFIIWGKIDDTMSVILQHSTRYLQSLLLDNLEITVDNWCKLLECIGEAELLQRIVIYLVTVISSDNDRKMKDVELDLSNHQSLQRVTFIDGVQDIPNDTPWLPLFAGLSGATNITEFRAAYIVPECIDDLLRAIPKLERLEMLVVTNVQFDHKTLILSNPKLKVLKCRQLEFIDGCIYLGNLKHLEQVHLDTLQMRTKSWEDLFDCLQTQPDLQIIDLADLDIGEAVVKLHNSRKIQKLAIWRVNMSQKSWRRLFADLSNPSSLEVLELISIEVEDAMLKLENNKGLERVNLADVQMSNESWKHFFGALSAFPNLSSLSLQRLKVGQVNFNLSKNGKLQELLINSVKSSQGSWVKLFDYIEGLPSLSKLTLMDCNIGTSLIKFPKSLKELEVYKLVLTEAAWQASLKLLKSKSSIKPQSVEIEEASIIFQDTDKYKYEGMYIPNPKELGNQTADSDILIEEVFHKYPTYIKVVRVTFNR